MLARSMIRFGLAVATGGWIEAVDVLAWADQRFAEGLAAAYRVTGTLAHKNLLSGALFLSLPFAEYGALRFKGVWQWLGAASFALTSPLLVILQTRSVWIAMAAAGWFASARSLLPALPGSGSAEAGPGDTPRRRRLSAGAYALLAAAVLTAALLMPDAFRHRLESLASLAARARPLPVRAVPPS